MRAQLSIVLLLLTLGCQPFDLPFECHNANGELCTPSFSVPDCYCGPVSNGSEGYCSNGLRYPTTYAIDALRVHEGKVYAAGSDGHFVVLSCQDGAPALDGVLGSKPSATALWYWRQAVFLTTVEKGIVRFEPKQEPGKPPSESSQTLENCIDLWGDEKLLLATCDASGQVHVQSSFDGMQWTPSKLADNDLFGFVTGNDHRAVAGKTTSGIFSANLQDVTNWVKISSKSPPDLGDLRDVALDDKDHLHVVGGRGPDGGYGVLDLMNGDWTIDRSFATDWELQSIWIDIDTGQKYIAGSRTTEPTDTRPRGILYWHDGQEWGSVSLGDDAHDYEFKAVHGDASMLCIAGARKQSGGLVRCLPRPPKR